MIAPARAKRPGAHPPREEASAVELEQCPFDEGREDRTPPETFAIGPAGRPADTPGWQVRVVPNLYPALERQEVIVHTPRHVRSLAKLRDDELPDIARAWHNRIQAAHDEGFAHPFLIVNEGRQAGGSLPHSHSQLVWLRDAPPEVAAELPRLEAGACALCDLLRDERLEIGVAGEVSLRAAPAGRAPYEFLVTGRRHEAEPNEEALQDALALLRQATIRLGALEGSVPLNAWLHAGGHWHFEVVPRLTILAGLELGAGIYVNWLAPEDAAERLRA